MANNDDTEPLLQPSISGKPHLQTLPAEIRLTIYKYLLPDHPDAPYLRCSRIATWRGSRARDRIRDPVRWILDPAKYGYVISVRSNIVNLARACRQFEDEILPLMYRQCTFEVAIGSTYPHVRSGIDKPIPLDASKIRNLELRLRGWDSALDKYRKEDLFNFFAGIQWGRNLKSATFVAHFTVVWKSEKEVMAFLCPAWEKLECPFRIEFAFMRFSEAWLWDQQEESKMVSLVRQFHELEDKRQSRMKSLQITGCDLAESVGKLDL